MAAGFMTHVTCRLTAKNRDQLRNPIRSVMEYGLPLPRGVLPSQPGAEETKPAVDTTIQNNHVHSVHGRSACCVARRVWPANRRPSAAAGRASTGQLITPTTSSRVQQCMPQYEQNASRESTQTSAEQYAVAGNDSRITLSQKYLTTTTNSIDQFLNDGVASWADTQFLPFPKPCEQGTTVSRKL